RSVDGTRLAVVTFDANAGAGQLVTMSATGGDVSAALMQAGNGQGPGRRLPLLQDVFWVPSGDRLLVNVYEEGNAFGEQAPRPSWLWEVPLTGGAPRKLGLLSLPFTTAG